MRVTPIVKTMRFRRGAVQLLALKGAGRAAGPCERCHEFEASRTAVIWLSIGEITTTPAREIREAMHKRTSQPMWRLTAVAD